MPRNFWKDLMAILKKENWKKARGNGAASFETQNKRKEILRSGFRLLWNLGYKIKSPKSFREHHMKVLAQEWEKQGIKDIQTRISVFRVFSKWIGKEGMIRESKRYVANPKTVRRSYVAKQGLTWLKNNIDVRQKLEEVGTISPLVEIILEVMWIFGLRVKEAMLLRPHMADRGAYLDVNRGTKNGRPRIADIDSDEKRNVIDSAKTFAIGKTSSLIPDGQSFNTYRKYFYRVCNKAEIGRKYGIVPHGLRHEFANKKYESIVGTKSPVNGGGIVARKDDDFARLEIAEDLGHSRKSVTSCYLGCARNQAEEKIDE